MFLNKLPRLLLTSAALAVGAVSLPAAAGANEIVPGEVIVQYENPQTGEAPSPAAAEPVVLKVDNVAEALKRLRAKSNVAYAVPNLIAHAAATSYMPNDPKLRSLQWNFIGTYGVRAPQAWANARAAGRPGGRGTVIAVIDTGVAYSNRSPYIRSPDFTSRQFVSGWDYVDGDRYANDANGHGTHVAGTIAEATNNGLYLSGLAYGARIMPIRVLDRAGEGHADDIARAIRLAADKGAKLINLSLEFDSATTSGEVRPLLSAISYARSRGALIVGASGNEGYGTVSYPARAPGVMSVGSTTESGCVSDFSNGGSDLDIVAPGGGLDGRGSGESRCRPGDSSRRDISQLTFSTEGMARRFGIPGSYEGTSMATPHVTAAAALVIATRVIGASPSPGQLEARLKSTARDFGVAGRDRYYGAGLLDAGAASAR
ncbi:MAG: S8 family serine peptidase [Actinobacteria bacterium]|uniref:Unannotated protein n=1 Tax=freshwater metagenome TaxID=449393 RepID=A0A6J5ZAW7_9ZZZZ|nr:S8 family serine peptidase [Actinomycetota bacterium]